MSHPNWEIVGNDRYVLELAEKRVSVKLVQRLDTLQTIETWESRGTNCMERGRYVDLELAKLDAEQALLSDVNTRIADLEQIRRELIKSAGEKG